MADFKEGDAVRVKPREVTGDDVKSGLYFAYFSGLVGIVDRVYDDGSVCVDIDIDSLGEEARQRHLDMQESERKRWLDGLSGEARGRLNEQQKQLKISYKILVSQKDLESNKGGKPKGTTAPKEASSSDAQGSNKGPAGEPDSAPKRLSEADLQAKEDEFLRSLQEKENK
ncbi:MAG: hypothetical protein ABFD54_16570 [Armatimonadota bacterium]|nr:hypothetical protein [bacterium]